MGNRIAQALTKLFERHRIIFWYDAKKELRNEFDALELPDIEKLELANNEFGVKYHLLREAPEQKFLLYHEGPQPEYLDNWLLDVQLAQGEFRTDQVGLWLSELELSLEFADVIQAHEEFFKAVKRKDSLKRLLKPDDTPGMVRLKMLGVSAGAEPRLDTVLESLLAELSEDRDDKFKLIARCGLDSFLWEQMKRTYGYQSNTPGIRDFVIELFKSCYAMGTDGQVLLSTDSLVFLRRWKDSRQYEASFESLSNECADLLGIEQDLNHRDFRTLIDLDYFRLIDQKIISELVRQVVGRTVSTGDVALWVRQRRQGHWYQGYRHLYEAVDYAAQFVHMLDEATLEMESMADGIQRYSGSWFRLDQLYRKYNYHVRGSGQSSLMGPLTEQIENLYSNNYLLKLNDRWQVYVDAANRWYAPSFLLQKEFFNRCVQPFLNKDKKVYVIISDALRYEIGDELLSLIRQEDRFDASLEPALSMLPSYTQLGMAALLPNKALGLADNDTGAVDVDGQSSQGTANRIRILDQAIKQRATALRAEELISLNKDDCRALVRDHDVVYIYHNLIDKTGDSRDSEERVFVAVEDTLQELVKVIKKLASANASNLLLISDHGFIYQNRVLEESDFSSAAVEGEQILFRNRRFVLGKGLKQVPELRAFKSEELGLAGSMEVHIPKSINRLRVKGAGSRFVHGGASLQEVVIPVVRINKKRKSDISSVEVDTLRGGTSVITSGQLALVFYQTEPSTEKVQPRILRAGLYTQDGELISDSHDLVFDLVSDNPRERELQVRFVLTRKADEANGQEVMLRLDEKVPGTSHYKEYKSLTYVMRRSFTSDFDF
ncbi:MAG: BREX-1 system phosphatase PglZ type A [Candidatus Thiodiazotropha taylori]|nr:BREX-1 system phosphatase PglZ type A [Candidatus Thiodiazotropha taylori]